MLREHKTATNVGVGLGIILEIVGRVLTFVGGTLGLLGFMMILVGVVCFIWGCMNYAEGKGHSKWFGLLGLLSCIGLIALVFLPDNHKESK